LRKKGPRLKGDERILGDSDFVIEVLEAADEQLALTYQLHSEGYDLEKVAEKVAKLYELNPQDIYESGKDRWRVEARSLFCYWAIRELGVAGTGRCEEAGCFTANGEYFGQTGREGSQGKRTQAPSGTKVIIQWTYCVSGEHGRCCRIG
jgi:hypothetical protein